MEMDEDELKLDPGFAARFDQDDRRPPCQLYLISPPAIDAGFVDRLAAAFDGGPVAAFQLRVKGMDEHSLARLADPIQKLCAAREVAFIVNDSISLAKRLGADGVHLGPGSGAPRGRRHPPAPDARHRRPTAWRAKSNR